jgi:ligand-binding SRPBCC domain-containing protein
VPGVEPERGTGRRIRIHRLERDQTVPRPVDEVFAFFSRARNLEAITPPWLRFEVLTPESSEMRVGTLIDYRLRLHGIPMRWTSRIEEWDPGRAFVDRLVRGPYRLWHHRHEFEREGSATVVRDRVAYALPLGPVGELAGAAFVHRDVERIFDYRREMVRRLLA